VDRAFVEAAHAAGLLVHPYTVNDPLEMRRLLDLGVDGMFTDRPALLDSLRRGR
jgi:glycerophosphoryl diester phosphodiesterase